MEKEDIHTMLPEKSHHVFNNFWAYNRLIQFYYKQG